MKRKGKKKERIPFHLAPFEHIFEVFDMVGWFALICRFGSNIDRYRVVVVAFKSVLIRE